MTVKNLLAAAALFLAGSSAQAFDLSGIGNLGHIVQQGTKALSKVGDTNCTANACGKGQSYTVQRCLLQPQKILQNKNCANAYYKNFCKRGSMGNQQACSLIAQSGVVKGVGGQQMGNQGQMYSQPMRQPSQQPPYEGQDPMPMDDMSMGNDQGFDQNQGFDQDQGFDQNQGFNNQRNMRQSAPQRHNGGGLSFQDFQ